MVSGATGLDAVLVAGSGVTLVGAVHAGTGSVRVAGSTVRLECGAVASAVAIEGAGISTPMTARCLPA